MTTIQKHIEIKRKLRELKKLELKVRFSHSNSQKNDKRPIRETKNIVLVWNKYFDITDEGRNHIKYTINQLAQMTKEELKAVIHEYFYEVYYECYREKGLTDQSFIDPNLLTQLGLPINTDDVELKRKFKELAKLYHPDNGGESSKFIELMEHYKDYRN